VGGRDVAASHWLAFGVAVGGVLLGIIGTKLIDDAGRRRHGPKTGRR
jgi:hypothetical protein